MSATFLQLTNPKKRQMHVLKDGKIECPPSKKSILYLSPEAWWAMYTSVNWVIIVLGRGVRLNGDKPLPETWLNVDRTLQTLTNMYVIQNTKFFSTTMHLEISH